MHIYIVIYAKVVFSFYTILPQFSGDFYAEKEVELYVKSKLNNSNSKDTIFFPGKVLPVDKLSSA